MQHALSLSRSGKQEESLREFLSLFERSRSDPSLVGVRLSFLLGEIARLGEKYPRALHALQARRDADERLALEGRAGSDDFVELQSLNKHLGESERTISLYDKLKSSGRPTEALARQLCTEFVQAKRRDDFLAIESDCLRRLASGFGELELEVDFPARGRGGADTMSLIRFSKEHRAIPVYETLLVFGRLDAASKIKKWLLRPKPDEFTYLRLIEAAIAAKRPEIGRTLVDEARSYLPASEMTQIDDIARRKLTP